LHTAGAERVTAVNTQFDYVQKISKETQESLAQLRQTLTPQEI